jgi:hypothetical protein
MSTVHPIRAGMRSVRPQIMQNLTIFVIVAFWMMIRESRNSYAAFAREIDKLPPS